MPCVITEATDVWSLGCTLYAAAFGHSPFEVEYSARGEARVADCSHLRVIARVPFPPRHPYSAGFVELILCVPRTRAAWGGWGHPCRLSPVPSLDVSAPVSLCARWLLQQDCSLRPTVPEVSDWLGGWVGVVRVCVCVCVCVWGGGGGWVVKSRRHLFSFARAADSGKGGSHDRQQRLWQCGISLRRRECLWK